MDDDHRELLRYGIELLTGGMAPLLELGVVITETQNDPVRLVLRFGDPVSQRLLQGRNAGDCSIRRGQQIGGERLDPGVEHMTMGIDKARDQGLALQVDHPGFAISQREDVALAAQRQDPAIPDGQRMRRRRRIIDGNDIATEINGLGGGVGWAGSMGRTGRQQCDGDRGDVHVTCSMPTGRWDGSPQLSNQARCEGNMLNIQGYASLKCDAAGKFI
ncbi:hypothetical protein D3C73_589050 [compost metagenome]